MAYDSSSVRALLTELQASSEACALIYKAASEEEAGAAASLDNEAAQNFMARPPSISDVVETARSLFATCQDGSCASADVTLALRGAADAEAVLQQVHRYTRDNQVHCACSMRTASEAPLLQVHIVCEVSLLSSTVF